MYEQKNVIKSNAIYYQSQVLNNQLSYCICLNGDKKMNLIFTKDEFGHLMGLGQYFKDELRNDKKHINSNNIFKNAKSGLYDINKFNEDICKKHHVHEKIDNFQWLVSALDNDFDIYKYKKNREFPNEEASYVIHSRLNKNTPEEKNILIFIDWTKDFKCYCRSFVPNPDMKKVLNMEKNLTQCKILYKDKRTLKNPKEVLFQFMPDFSDEVFIEKLTPKEKSEREKYEKVKLEDEEKKERIKREIEKQNKTRFAASQNQLDEVKNRIIQSGHIIRNNFTIDGLEIIVDKTDHIFIKDNSIMDIQNAIKILENILKKDKMMNKQHIKNANINQENELLSLE